ncbi:hypothetical protein T492DRAFT_850265 [Pavlovales sp. CCMP2436]|nr:hypothetical protein T492DRAFT_850265 [Pavlovales sp. CCMP2436]
MVMRMNAEKTSGVAVQDVDAPVDCVLAQIINGEDYVGKVPGLSSVKNYAEKKRGDGAVLTKATYLLKLVMGYQLEYFINQIYVPKNRCLTWTLDYSRKSDLHDSAGYWRVDPLPGQPGRSRVFYSSSSLVLGMPQFVMDLLTSQALKASTAWVKKYAEKEYAPKRAAAAAAATPTSAGGGEKRFSWRSALARKCRAKVGDDGSTSRAAVAEAEAESKADWKNRIFNFTFLASMLLVHLRPSQNFFVMAS